MLGGFDPAYSDIDALVVVRTALERPARTAFAEQVSETALPCPAVGLELSIVQLSATRRPTAEPPYELHVETRGDRVVEDGGDGDPDLVLHFAVCRAHGRLVGAGEPVGDVFAPVPARMVLRQMRDELEWAMTAPGVVARYTTLNAARNWHYLETGQIVSKEAGGRWARERGADRDDSGALATSVIEKLNAALD